MKLLFVLISLNLELPPGAQAQINLHIHNNTSITLIQPKRSVIQPPWYISTPQHVIFPGNISPGSEGILTFPVSA